ncbi:probable JmjC domain-containing histone demethylation protein 2C [Oncorhynchus keta]|uniref:probable JmjC domain-containing histone demethylation protein 2C n=1 Tax=Oncorhynchus keta TaxID=8018 RepID=UPI00227C01A1|nr:probable JmjC domain-containing histone demethylation protein 2C [Oncorhynchus keta]
MVVMNDQVLEPQNVDPSMIQMTFLDDVVHSLLKGENIGIQSRRRSRSNQNNSAHGHYTRAQANSPRPVMNSSGGAVKQGSGVTTQQGQGQGGSQSQHSPCQEQTQHRGPGFSRRKGSDSSVPDDDFKGDNVDCNERAGRGGEDDGEDRTRGEEIVDAGGISPVLLHVLCGQAVPLT